MGAALKTPLDGPPRFYGKHRGVVTRNDDDQMLGRLQVSVPDFPAMKEAWAMPSTPYAGAAVGFYAMPPVGANVWVEFEGGELDAPIWSGCFWTAGEVPGDPISPDIKVWRTKYTSLVIDDRDDVGGVRLAVDKPAVGIAPLSIVFDKTGITIDCASDIASTIKLQPDAIIIEHPQARITLKADQIIAEVPPGTHTIKADQVVAEAPPGKHTVSSSGGVIAEFPPGKSTTGALGVALEAGGGTAKVMPAMVEIQAPLVKLN